MLGIISILGMYFYLKDDLPSVDVLRDVELKTPMRIFTQDGKLISQYGVQRRIPVSLDEVPEALIQAVIATEDSRFYDHMGVDPIGVARAALNLVITGEKGQGASTLTMQLARGFFLDRRKQYSRKVKEIFIAYHMEQELSKDEILELYLNKIELGHRSFGMGAAARVYYGKPLNELNLAQLATLAGLPKAPSALNPISQPERSKERRRIVLLRMLDEGYISEAEFDVAANAPVSAKKHGAEIDVDAPFLADVIYNEVVSIYGKDIAESSGFSVYATAFSETQEAAQYAVVRNLHDYDERHGYRGPLEVLWQPLTSELVAQYGESEPLSPEAVTNIEQQHGRFAPMETAEIINTLQNHVQIGTLIPAVVTNVAEQSAQVLTKEEDVITLDWEGLDWARPYISDSAQGPDPQTASDILHEGMLVYVRQRPDDSVWQLAQMPDVSGALIVLDPFDGAVEAVVGGYDFYDSQFNRATQAKRQVGSNIKPFIYASALDHGYTLASIINDAPINQWDASAGVAWRPQNSPAVYDGPIPMRQALGKSKNVVSVRLLRGVGLDKTREYLTQFGFLKDEIPRDETMSLGSGSHTPLEVATALAIISNGGFAVQPYFIQRIENRENEVIWEAEPLLACNPCESIGVSKNDETQNNVAQGENAAQDVTNLVSQEFSFGALENIEEQQSDAEPIEKTPRSAPRVISEQTAFLVSEMMRSAVRANGNWNTGTYWIGTGWRARNLLQRTDIGGKTGTTNDAKDTWFSGFGPGLVATSWIGFDDPSRQLGRATRNQNLIDRNPERFNWIGNTLIGAEDGAKAAQPAWIRFMQRALANTPEQSTLVPEGIIRVRIDRETGMLTQRTDASSMFEYFRKGSEPTSFVDNNILLPESSDAEDQEDTLLEDIF